LDHGHHLQSEIPNPPFSVLRSLLKKGLLDLLSANFLIQFLGFGTLMLVPRFVSAESLGALKIIQSYASLLVILAGFGYNSAVLKLCAETRPEKEKAWFLKVALVRTSWATLLVWGGATLLSFTGLFAASPQVAAWLPVYNLSLPFLAWTLVLTSYLQALRHIRAMARAQVLVKLQSVLLVVLATWLWGFEGFILSTVLGYAIGLWPFFRQIGTTFWHQPRQPLPTLFTSMAVYSMLGNAVHTLAKHGDLYLLGLYNPDPVETGYYSLATIFIMGATIVVSTVQTLTLPYFSEKGWDGAWVRKYLVKTQWQTVGVGVGIAVLVHLAAWGVIRLLYSPDYLRTMVYLDVLLLYFVLRSGYAIIGTALMGIGLPKYNLMGVCISTPVSLLLGYLGLQRYGMMGLAWAQVIAQVFTLVLLIGVARYALRQHYGPPR
jgi:O-antigen/teichoic acid export membrane protein